MSNTFILLVGPSGTGKTTIANGLFSKYGWRYVDSFTTRPPRFEGEKGHIFISDEEMDRIIETDPPVAFTNYNGYRYCGTNSQIEENDIYVIDPNGVFEFVERYKGSKVIKLVYLRVSEWTRMQRMMERHDSTSSIIERLEYDKEAFSEEIQNRLKSLFDRKNCMFIVNSDINKTVEDIFNFSKM